MTVSETTGARILIVGDESAIAIDLRGSLRRLGYTTPYSPGPTRDAVERASHERPDLVLLVVGATDESVAVEQMRRSFAVPIVRLAASSDAAALGTSRQTNALGDLIEPFGERELHLVVELALLSVRREKERETLLQERAARDGFLSVAAHELRTPLSALLLALYALERAPRPINEAKLDERIAGLRRQLQSLADLIDRILDVSRIRAGELELTIAEMDIAQLVRDTADSLRGPAERSGSMLTVRAPATLIGRWDRLRLGQVVTNILGNALKFGAGKPIEVVLREDNTEVTLSVRDHGIGIPTDALPHVFDAFERGVSVQSHGGLGLGLYVARRIVEAHGGRIEARGEPEGGTSFVVQLPRRQGEGST